MSLIPMDKLYLENLEEFIFDDRSFVSYKFLSCKLGVHVNLAKQMLFQFLEMSKSKGKEIYAMYYISGMAPQRWIFSKNFPKEIPSKTNKENTNPLSPDLFVSPSADQEDVYGDANGNLVMLCQDHELEELKEKFTKIFSIHVYGLSTYPMNLEKLNEELSTRVVDGEGRGPNHYGSITCKTASEIREKGNNKQFESAIKNINHVKVPKKEKEEKVIFVKKEKTVEAPAKEKIVEKAVGGVGKDRLKNMFAAAASKPKPKAKEVEVPVESKRKSKEEEKPVKKESTCYSKTWNSKRKETLKSKPETEKENLNRKRKRIRDVFSSEEEESDSDRKNTSEEEEDTLPESPIPRKRIQIESDSDEESFKSKSQDEPTTPEQKKSRNSSGEEKTSTGKKRVCKTIKKRHVDEDGFLVTVLQKVMGSDSDSSDESEKVTNVKKESSQSSQEEPCTISKNKPKEEKSKKKVAPKKASPTPATQKAKQSSLMSFFQKK